MSAKSPRKAQKGTTTRSVDALHAASVATPINPPTHVSLRPGDRPFWDDVLRSRARELWTDADLIHAGNLARCMADIERLQGELTAEGDALKNDRGTPVANPKHAILETLSRRSIALTRMLQVAPTQQTKRRDADSAKFVEDEAKKALHDIEDDDLIPRASQLQ